MHGLDVAIEARERAERGEAVALATVVWRQAPSSGKLGSRALITASGELHGWIGGACAEPVVIREARRVIERGAALLLLLGPAGEFGQVPEGTVVVPISCQSEGALQVYIEPVLPAPSLVVVGGSPMARTLADLASVIGWRARVVPGEEFTTADADERSLVVIATLASTPAPAAQAGPAASAGYPETPAVPPAPPGPSEAVDPVCGMTVTAGPAGRPLEHDGVTYYFCCPGCRRAFGKDPAAYLEKEASRC